MNDTPPTAEESLRIAAKFLDVAIGLVESGTATAIDRIEEFIGADNETAELHIWYWAAVGPVVTAAGIRKLDVPDVQDGMWAIEMVPGVEASPDPSLLAALRAVVAHLNDDTGAAQDVTSAHFAVAGHDGLLEMVFELLKLCSFLVKEGAFK
jgi:hypothetical protein